MIHRISWYIDSFVHLYIFMTHSLLLIQEIWIWIFGGKVTIWNEENIVQIKFSFKFFITFHLSINSHSSYTKLQRKCRFLQGWLFSQLLTFRSIVDQNQPLISNEPIFILDYSSSTISIYFSSFKAMPS